MANSATALPPAASFCPDRPELVFTCEHGGCRIPAAYAGLFSGGEEILGSHRGWDGGALDLARRLAAALAAPLLFTETSRLLIDCNRSRHHPRLFSAFTRGLDQEQRQGLVDRFYLPHRRAVLTAVGDRIAAGATVVHIAVHSFTPVLDTIRRRADIGLLYDPARPAERYFCRAWQNLLDSGAPGLAVRRNSPYRGVADGLTTALRRQFPGDRYLGIELEMNQRLLDGDGRFPAPLSATLAETLGKVLADRSLGDRRTGRG